MTANSWGADVCSGCHSISVSMLPGQEELDRFYAQYNLTYSGGGRKRGSVDRQDRYAKKYLSCVRRYRGCGKLLDVGSSNNPFPNYAATAGFSVTVLDHVRPSHLSSEIEFINGCGRLKAPLIWPVQRGDCIRCSGALSRSIRLRAGISVIRRPGKVHFRNDASRWRLFGAERAAGPYGFIHPNTSIWFLPQE